MCWRWGLSLLLSLLLSACSRPQPVAPAPGPTAAPTPAPRPVSRPISDADKARALATSAELVRSGRCGEAISLLHVLLDAYPEMEDYHLHYLGLCASSIGDDAGAIAAWSRIVTSHPLSLHAPAAALEWGRRLRVGGDRAAAESLLRRAAAAEEIDVAQAARFELAEIAAAHRDVRTAYAMFSALREQATGDVARQAQQAVVALRREHADLAPRTASEREAEVAQLQREGNYVEALRLVNGLLATATERDRPRLLRRRAVIERDSGDTERHLGTLREIHETYPRSPEASEALFQEARWLWNKDHDARARLAFLEFERRYPRSGHMVTVRYALGRIAQAAGDRATALSRFGSVIERHPNTALAHDSRWQRVWIRYYDRQWDAAEQELASLARGRPTAQAADANYWRGRALEHAGRTAAARAAYQSIVERAPDSYYARLAAERLGQPAPLALARLNTMIAPFPRLPSPLQSDYHLFRAVHLHRAGMMSAARREVRAFARGDAQLSRDLMIGLYRAVDGHRQAIRLASDGGTRDTSILYPLAFWDLIQTNASRYQVDPLLALSLMRQESLFDPEARSPANARGLMQLLPSTAEAVAARIGRTGRLDLYDPTTNIELGIAHLRELADQYAGDAVRILAAYNGGATAVARWDQRFAGRPPDEYVESITYRETRDYVKKVLSNYRTYQRVYGAGPRTDVRTGREQLGRHPRVHGRSSS